MRREARVAEVIPRHIVENAFDRFDVPIVGGGGPVRPATDDEAELGLRLHLVVGGKRFGTNEPAGLVGCSRCGYFFGRVKKATGRVRRKTKKR